LAIEQPGVGQIPNGWQLRRLLRACRKRPRGSGAAKQRDELATPHSITSSARVKHTPRQRWPVSGQRRGQNSYSQCSPAGHPTTCQAAIVADLKAAALARKTGLHIS
jgi:hypothetical protein